MLKYIFFFLTFQLYSQTSVTFKSSNSKEVISYAKVFLKNKSKPFKMFYTDSLGTINKELLLKSYIIDNKQIKADVVEVEAFNYESKTLLLNQLLEVIYLKENTEVLPELIIENIPLTIIGDNQTKGKDIGIGIMGKSAELVMLFNKSSKDKVNYLKSFNFLINKQIKKNEFILRLVVYENRDGLPTKMLYQSQPTILKYKDKGWMNILFDNEIEIPDAGLFIGIEYILPVIENSKHIPAFIWRNYNDGVQKKVFTKWQYKDFSDVVEYNKKDPVFLKEGFKNMYPVFFIEVFEGND